MGLKRPFGLFMIDDGEYNLDSFQFADNLKLNVQSDWTV